MSTEGAAAEWAASGQGSGNSEYRRQILRFGPVETGFDESVPLRTLFVLWLSAAIPSFIVWMFFFIIWTLLVVGESSLSSDDSFHPGVLTTGSVLATIAFWVILLLCRVPEPIAEWKTVLEDKASAAPSSYAAIYRALWFRQVPVQVTARRIRSDILQTEAVNNRLVVIDRSYVAYVSVFEYGTGLYVGWTMWRNRRGAELLLVFFKDLFGGFSGRTGLVNQMLRTEKARAMREALHSAVREGIDVAVAGTEVSIVSTFGHELPVENLPGDLTAPAPPPPPAGA